MKYFILFILSMSISLSHAQFFPNGGFEEGNCTDCKQTLDCATDWFTYQGSPQIVSNYSENCNYIVCNDEHSLLLRDNPEIGSDKVGIVNPFYDIESFGLHTINLSFLNFDGYPSSDFPGKLQVFGDNGGTLVLLGETGCINGSTQCSLQEVVLGPAVKDFNNLVLGVIDCTLYNNRNSSSSSSSSSSSRMDPHVNIIIDDVVGCENNIELGLNIGNCNELCFTVIENSECGSLENPFINITFVNEYEILLTPDDTTPVCIVLNPGESITFEVEYNVTISGITHSYLDTIEYTQPNPQTTAGFILVDEANHQSDLFCVGEPVSFVNTNTNDETEWFIQICQREIGAPAGSDCINWKSNRPYPGGWNQGEVPAVVDLLSEVWATGNQSNWIFWGGYEYTVGLAVRNKPCFSWIDYNQTFIVEPCEVEIAHISQYPTEDECTFCFQPSVTYSECVGDLLYLWNFGDGTTSNEFSPCHTFSGNGNYDVTLYIEAYTNISTSLPCATATESTIACVHSCGCECDVDNNGFEISIADNGCTVSVSPIEPYISSCTTVLHYKWSWGDGSYTVTNDLEIVEHTYLESGVYGICLEIGATGGDDQFCYGTICEIVPVSCNLPDGDGGDYSQKIFNDNASTLIEVTPNPTTGEILLGINKSWGKNVKLNIISITGQVLIESILDAETDRNIKFDLTDFDSGIYILHLEDEFGKTEFTKIMKQ